MFTVALLVHFKPVVWNLIPDDVKYSYSLDGFLYEIR